MAPQTGSGYSFEHRNLVLIGFMATGKTAVGRILARRLKRRFMDTDALVEELAGAAIPVIFRRHGEAYFRELESEAIAELDCYPAGSLVIAAGGGAVLREGNMARLRKHGPVILLTASVNAVLRRTRRHAGRPLLTAGGARQEAVLSLLHEREPFYRLHDLKVDTTGKRPSQVAGEIIKFIRCQAPE